MIPLAGQQLMHLLAIYGYWAVLAIVGLESLGIPLPGETTLVAAAIYAGATHHLSIELVILAAIGGAVIGDNVGYAIGRWGGYRILLRYGRYVRLDEGKVKLGRYIFLKHGSKVVFFGRFISILRTYAAFLAGTLLMPWWRFFIFNATGGIVWASIYGIGAYLLGGQLNRLSRPVEIVLGVVAGVVIISFLVFIARNEKRLEKEAELALPGPLEPSRGPAGKDA
jgi:membrane protein DedA with SNARE-associated domain